MGPIKEYYDTIENSDPSQSPLGMFDRRQEPLWGDTVSQDPKNFPTEYVDPRTLPPLEPAGPNGSRLSLSNTASSPAEQSPDWGKVIQGIAGAGLAGIAAGRGDLTFGMRMASQMQQMDLQKQQAARQQKQMEMQEEQNEMARYKMFPDLLDSLDKARDKFGSDDETVKKMAPLFAETFNKVMRTEFKPDQIERMLKDPGQTQVMRELFPELEGLPPAQLRQLAKNPAQLEKLAEKKRGQLGDDAFVQLQDLRNKGVLKPEATKDDVEAIFPQSKYLSDEQRLRLGWDTKATLEAKVKDEPARLRHEEREDRAERQFQESQRQFKESQKRLYESQDRADARQIRANAEINERLEKRLALTEEQQRRVGPGQLKTISGNQRAIAAINDYETAYNNLLKETKGRLSPVFKGVLVKNAQAKTMADLTNLQGGTDAENKFAGEYRALVGNIRSLTDEVGVLTDVDAVRILGSFDPATTPNQVKANLEARRRRHVQALEIELDSLEAIGKDVSKLRNAPGPKTTVAPATMRFNPATGKLEPTTQSRPRARNPQTNEVVEWDGKAWVKVKDPLGIR